MIFPKGTKKSRFLRVGESRKKSFYNILIGCFRLILSESGSGRPAAVRSRSRRADLSGPWLNSTTACVWRSLWAIGRLFPAEDAGRRSAPSRCAPADAAVVAHQHPVVVRVFALVAVDEYEVEHTQSGAISSAEPMGAGCGSRARCGEERLRQLFQFVFNLDGMQFGLPSVAAMQGSNP